MTLNAKQFDTGRIFVFNIMDNDEPFDLSDCEVYLRIAKADGTQFQGHECCIISGNTVTVDTSISNGEQILACSGLNRCELHLRNSEGKSLTTWNFNIDVMPRVHNGDHIDSIDSWDAWDKINDTIDDITNKIENHYFVLTVDKDIAGGVPSLDENAKIPTEELYDATTEQKGITQLTDSIESNSITTAATPNSVKQVNDQITEEIKRATETENEIKLVIDENKSIWDDKYTKDEIDNKGFLTTLDFLTYEETMSILNGQSHEQPLKLLFDEHVE